MKALHLLTSLALGALSAHAQAVLWGQCGGIGWTGATSCVANAACTAVNSYYSQCIPSTVKPTYSSVSPAPPSGTCAPVAPPANLGKLRFGGVTISGFEYGCNTLGFCNASAALPPLAQFGGADGVGQMGHFVQDDGFNVFRLPVGWQFLTNGVLTSALDGTNFKMYDTLVQACLATGASCVIDLHNYARWNNQIIGQGGPSDAVFAELWGNIASIYANNTGVIFEIMNEPHDLPSISLWAGTVQAAVAAIRKAGATSQIILLPGTDYASAATFVSSGSADALNNITNLDGSTTNLVFDVQQFLDSDNTGTHADCVTDNVNSVWSPLAEWAQCNGRKIFNTATGGGNTASCQTLLPNQISFQSGNADVFVGYIGWAAGGFDISYVLSETPEYENSVWTDQPLVATSLSPKVNRAVFPVA